MSPYRVLDLTGELGFLCSKILGDLGADVIKVEPPGGDPARKRGPFVGDEPDPEKSIPWLAHNVNKRGITLSLESWSGQDILSRLAQRADIVVESFSPGYLARLGLGYEELSRANPSLILTSITPFGQKGLYSHCDATDIEIMAMGGFMSLVGEPGRPPLRVSWPQSAMWAGMYGALGTLTALYFRSSTGQGQQVDVSAQASVVMALAQAPMYWDINRELPQRQGVLLTGRSVTGAVMRSIWPCRDGYINFIIYGGPAGVRTMEGLVEWMSSRGMAPDWLLKTDWRKFQIATVTQAEIDRIEEALGPFFSTLTRQEFFREAVARGMLGYPVSTAQDILEDPHLQERDFWVDFQCPEEGLSIRYPGPFARFSEGGCSLRRPAPRIGQHNIEVYRDELGYHDFEMAILAEEGVI